MLERDDVGMPDDTRDWRREAACVGTDPELFFPTAETGPIREAEVLRAKRVCAGCPVRTACLDWALDNLAHGVAGGCTPAERSRMRQKRLRPIEPGAKRLVEIRGLSIARRGELAAAGRRALTAGASRTLVMQAFGVTRRTVDRWAASLGSEGAERAESRSVAGGAR
ncbi:hypothetical protein GCM10009836_45700 [Pseudonocardia ailaonensis]|uniref:Transcriptional regulator WhiB n=2 Tax=Pseudonocardia ailaonensis TaxID=367279 RepID=A0ABN2NAP6_9PSEU